jgi:hypothetical protein
MHHGKMQSAPVYNDGCFALYDLVDVPDRNNPDFPIRKIRRRKIGVIGFRELAIYDRTRVTFEQADKQITMKIAIPRWDGISSDCVLVINGNQHKVFNCAQVISKQGYPETELTLINPDMTYEVAGDDEE